MMTTTYNLLAICLSGLEELVCEDIRAHLDPNCVEDIQVLTSPQVVVIGEAACGKILVKLRSAPLSLDIIRSVQCWMVYLFHESSLSSSSQTAMKLVHQSIEQTDVLKAFSQWKDISTPHNKAIASLDQPRFCARCVRDGDHYFNSLDMAKSIGDAIVLKTEWKVSLKEMDLEALCIIHNSLMVLGLLLPIGCRAAMKSKLPSELRPPSVNASVSPSLRPSTAYLMVKLANPKRHEVLLDGMCGAGTIIAEASYGHHCISLGGDVDPSNAPKLKETLQNTFELSNKCAISEVTIPN